MGGAFVIEACYIATCPQDLNIGGFSLIDLFAFLACHPHMTKPYVQQFVHYLDLFLFIKNHFMQN